ncbi:hypothetical protein N1E65_30830 [Pseudomonas aeruginosa]|nr:hypothetical protein [Pseudomonas aeruginosa]MCS9418003.1 hypothetical protein [Pseudomonas aeruginosa]MCS9525111.1 hypothetical protein [Pseudomonas aeruginosa]
MEFKFLLPAKVVMGPDLRERTGEYLRELGMAHVLIVTDAGVKCGFHADSDTHSTRIRTVIPR